MTADLAQQQLRIPDDSRPLLIGRPTSAVVSTRLGPFAEPVTCTGTVWGERYDCVPAYCRRLIQPGDHYLLLVETNGDGEPSGRTFPYCAPCAVHDAAAWDVQEAVPS